MAEYFKVWIEVERIDEEKDIYEEAGDLPHSIGGIFETEEEAMKFVDQVVEAFQ